MPSSNVNTSSLPAQIQTTLTNYINNLGFGSTLQINNIVTVTSSVQGVANARLANANDSSYYYGIQEVNPYIYYDTIDDIIQGSSSSVDVGDLELLNTYSGDVQINSDSLPNLFSVNVLFRSENDF